MAGEVGLSGEVRPVSRIEQRIAEAEKLGFQHDAEIMATYGARYERCDVAMRFVG